jgi:hypothetical protein
MGAPLAETTIINRCKKEDSFDYRSRSGTLPGTHPRVMRRPWNARDAWRFVQGLLASPGLGVLVQTERHAAVAGQVIDEMAHLSGDLVHDAHSAILMREHGIRRICTRDADVHRFPFLDVVDPLQPQRPAPPGRRPSPRHRRRMKLAELERHLRSVVDCAALFLTLSGRGL